MPLLRRIFGNSVADMKRYGYIVMEFDLALDKWIGFDAEGNRWEISAEQMELLDWNLAECNDRFYRCIYANVMAREHLIPSVPCHE